MNNNPPARWFTAYRFEDGYREQAENVFRWLAHYGLTPAWQREAPCQGNPGLGRALLINLPKVETERFRVVKEANPQRL